jgi:hypothetical protein
MDKLLTAEEYYLKTEEDCKTHEDYIEFADHYAGYTYTWDQVSKRERERLEGDK